jgi:hypothetical protein
MQFNCNTLPPAFRNNLALIYCLLTICIGAAPSTLSAQSNPDFKLHKKGRSFFHWGYNRAWYNKSDIHFKGQGHDFVLSAVKAKDRPNPLSLVYIKLSTLTIPQFNCHFGYFISDKYSLAIGWDHMKYVGEDFQTVKMNGYVDPATVSDPEMVKNMNQLNSLYATDGIYQDVPVQMTPNNFVHIEHTDGLNYASIELDRYEELWQSKKHNKLGITAVTSLGSGLIIPRTDSHLFGSGENHYWNVAGWGASAKLGLQINLTKHLYLQTDFKCGYLQMNHVHTSNYLKVDKAKQHIVFYENIWQIGVRF